MVSLDPCEIHLNYNASTPVDPRVAEVMRGFLEHAFGNPSERQLGRPLGAFGKCLVT